MAQDMGHGAGIDMQAMVRDSGAHISRTMMLAELSAVLANVPQGSGATDYREAILQQKSHLQNCRSKMDARRVADWCRSGQDSAYLMLPAAATFWRV
jgi:hypothetical protein